MPRANRHHIPGFVWHKEQGYTPINKFNYLGSRSARPTR